MSGLTDLEICKRIAEIEGTELFERDGVVYDYFQNTQRFGIIVHSEYNPLTDDALCFQLMVKYQRELNYYNNEDGEPRFYVCAHGVHSNNYDNPNRAICLAIIKANK